jgi:hypothetical protein
MPGSSIVLCAIGKSASTTTKTGLRAGFENTSLEGQGKKVLIRAREGIMRVLRGAPSLLLVSCVTATAQLTTATPARLPVMYSHISILFF